MSYEENVSEMLLHYGNQNSRKGDENVSRIHSLLIYFISPEQKYNCQK